MKKNIFVFFLFFCQVEILFAQELNFPNSINGPITFCAAVKEAKSQQLSRKERLRLLQETLLLKFFPRAFAKPYYESIVPNTLQLESGPSELKNYIFALGPIPEDLADFKTDLAAKESYKINSQRIARYQKSLLAMLRARTLERCYTIYKKDQFDYQLYVEALNQLAQMPWPRQQEELSLLSQKLKRTLPRLELKWELVPYSRLEHIHEILGSPDVGNVIVIGHGKSNGHLVDSSLTTYPIGLFANLSPTLMSLSLYSCYGEQTIETYNLQQEMKDAPSIYPQRFLINVQNRTEKLSGAVAPINGAKSFVKKIDHFLSKKFTPANLVHGDQPQESQCHLSMANITLEQGKLGVSLNRKFLGILDSAQTDKQFVFPCRFLKKDKKNLLVVNSLNNSKTLQGNLSQVEIHLNNRPIESSKLTHYLTPEQNFRSLLVNLD